MWWVRKGNVVGAPLGSARVQHAHRINTRIASTRASHQHAHRINTRITCRLCCLCSLGKRKPWKERAMERANTRQQRTSADHDSGGCCQAQGAGAGDDQDGDAKQQGKEKDVVALQGWQGVPSTGSARLVSCQGQAAPNSRVVSRALWYCTEGGWAGLDTSADSQGAGCRCSELDRQPCFYDSRLEAQPHMLCHPAYSPGAARRAGTSAASPRGTTAARSAAPAPPQWARTRQTRGLQTLGSAPCCTTRRANRGGKSVRHQCTQHGTLGSPASRAATSKLRNTRPATPLPLTNGGLGAGEAEALQLRSPLPLWHSCLAHPLLGCAACPQYPPGHPPPACLSCAFSTSRTIWDSAVSAPTLQAGGAGRCRA